jgi:Eukaryotic protein of unknown function (DUF829)
LIVLIGKGFDVLHIKANPTQILWPARAQAVAAQIVDFVTAPSRRSQPILVHGFSVGGYLYGETLVRMTSDPIMAEEMSRRVRGQIFDSPVDMEGVPRGVSLAVTGSRPAQIAIKSSLDTYLALLQKQVTRHYIRSSAYSVTVAVFLCRCCRHSRAHRETDGQLAPSGSSGSVQDLAGHPSCLALLTRPSELHECSE